MPNSLAGCVDSKDGGFPARSGWAQSKLALSARTRSDRAAPAIFRAAPHDTTSAHQISIGRDADQGSGANNPGTQHLDRVEQRDARVRPPAAGRVADKGRRFKPEIPAPTTTQTSRGVF